MRGCPPRTDEMSGLFPRLPIPIRAGMDHEQNNMPREANGLSSIVAGVWAGAAEREWFIEHQPRGFEAQTVVPLVRAVFLVSPGPFHGAPEIECNAIM